MSGVRYVQGDTKITNGSVVATAQAVERFDAVALQTNTVVRAQDITWASAVATPSAPTVADGGVAVGTPFTNALTGVKVSVQFPWGEGALSAAGTATPTATALLKITLAALPSPGLYWNVYIETAAGSGIYKLAYTATQGGVTYASAYGAGQAPPSAAASGAKEVTQYNFAKIFLGLSNQRKIATVARIYGNSTDNKIQVNRAGVFEFDCASTTFNAGDYVGMEKDTGNVLMNQTVAAVANEGLAIGRVFEDVLSAAVKVKVELLSRYVAVGPQLNQ